MANEPTTGKIVGPDGKPILQEIASIKRDINQTVIYGGVLLNLDDTLSTRGQAKGLKIYDDIERDCHAYAVLQKRKKAVVAREWQVTPASESAIDVAAAELVTEQLKAIDFDKLTEDMLDATLKGFAVGEIMWAVDGSRIVIAEVIPRDQRRFTFGEDRGLRLITAERLIQGEPMPDRKFIVHRFGAKDGSPYGLGLGHKLFWPVFFKRQDITFWLTFADKFGSPTSLGKYPAGATPDDQAKLLAVLQAIAQDSGVIVPEGMNIELLEAARSGSIDTYEKLARYMDEQISECVLGETMTTTAQASGLGSNQASVHNEVRVELAKADADLLCGTLNNTIVRWLVEFNMPGAALPKVWRDFEEPEDLKLRAERDQLLYGLGYEPDEEYIRATYGEGWRKRTVTTPPGLPFPSFAEGDAATANRDQQQALADAAEQLSTQWRELVGKRLDDLLAMLEETQDLALFRERLGELLLVEPTQEVIDAIARAGFASHLLGRAKQ